MRVNKPSLPLAHESRRRSCTPRRIVKTLLALGVLLIFTQTLSWDMPQTLDPQAQASSVQFDNITRAAGIHFPHRSSGLNPYSETNSLGTLAVFIQPSLYLLAGDGLWGRRRRPGKFREILHQSLMFVGCLFGLTDGEGALPVD